VDWLPNTVAEWETTSESERISISLDWDHLLSDYLGELDVHYSLGDMTDEQQDRYRTILQKLHAALPLFARIGVSPPRIPLQLAPLPETVFTHNEIDAQLSAIKAETASLPRRHRQEISNLDKPEGDWRFDWHNFAARLRGLESAATAGRMTEAQQGRYYALRAFLDDYLAFLRYHDADVLSPPRTVKSSAAD